MAPGLDAPRQAPVPAREWACVCFPMSMEGRFPEAPGLPPSGYDLTGLDDGHGRIGIVDASCCDRIDPIVRNEGGLRASFGCFSPVMLACPEAGAFSG